MFDFEHDFFDEEEPRRKLTEDEESYERDNQRRYREYKNDREF